MRVDREGVFRAVCACLTEVNRQLPPERRLAGVQDAVVLGEGGALDSLALIDLLVNVEERLASETGARIQLLDDSLTAEGAPPFRTLGQMADWIVARQPPG